MKTDAYIHINIFIHIGFIRLFSVFPFFLTGSTQGPQSCPPRQSGAAHAGHLRPNDGFGTGCRRSAGFVIYVYIYIYIYIYIYAS